MLQSHVHCQILFLNLTFACSLIARARDLRYGIDYCLYLCQKNIIRCVMNDYNINYKILVLSHMTTQYYNNM